MLSPGVSMPDWLRQRAQSTPERLALVTSSERLTFRELDEAVDALAGRLLEAGVASRDVVAVLSWNSGGFVRAVHAVARIDAVLMPLNVRLSLDELSWQLQDSGARFLLHDAANAPAAKKLGEALSGLVVLSLDVLVPEARPSPAFSPQPALRQLPSPWQGEGQGEGRIALDARRFDLDALHSIFYTSGTTGRPKGAMLTYGNHLWSAVGSALNLGVLPDDRWLACLPLFHVGGHAILQRSVIYGSTAIVHESFDAVRVNGAIDEDGVTIVSVVAAMLQQMLDARGDVPYPPTLRCVLLGGGPAPRPLLERCAALGVPVVQTYGLTETASQATTLTPEEALSRLASAGKPLFGTEVRIEREDGSSCAADEAGEIVLRGPTVTPGYLNRPDETSRALRNGWLHTGDVGYLDAEGYLYVLDRRDDLIITGGENVYPAQVEAMLQAHPAVLEAGVIGVPDESWGQVPVAVVVLRPGQGLSEAELLSFCRERLAHFKAPSRIVFTDALPRNASGKLLRNELRARFG